MIQLTKDLFITNNNLNKTPKEVKNTNSYNPDKDFARILKKEDEYAEAKSDSSEIVCNEEGVCVTDNFAEKEKKAASNKNGEFFSINLQSLIGTDNEDNSTDAAIAEDYSDEAVISDENEELINAKVDLSVLSFGLENVKDNIILASATDFHVEDKSLPEISRNFEFFTKQNSDHQAFPMENNADINSSNNLLSGNEKADFDEIIKEVIGNHSLKTSEASENPNLKTGEASENHKLLTSEVLENHELNISENLGNQNIKTSEVFGNQNLAADQKSEIKEQKRFEAANTPYLADDVSKEKDPSLAVDNVQTKTEIKVTDETADKAYSVTEKGDAHKTSDEDNTLKHEGGKADHKRHSEDPQIKSTDKEADIYTDKNLDKDMVNRTGFYDFMQKVSEERSTDNSSSAKPQYMELINRGPSAFSESVGNVIRFISTGGLTKATLIIDPPALGKVNIEIISTDNGIETILKVSNEQVKTLVQDQIIQLKQNLEQIGVNLTEFRVDIQKDNENSRDQYNNKPKKARGRATEEEESETEKIEAFRVDLRKGLLHWIA